MQLSGDPDFFVSDWRARPQMACLERDGVRVEVEDRSMQVLQALARHAPQLVSKRRLLEEVWGQTAVSEQVLSHAIWELRKVFGDKARNPRFIETVTKKGYRLLVEVRFDSPPETLEAGTRIGTFEILSHLGSGAMGEVYEALDHRLERRVALKFLAADLLREPDSRRRFLREARAAAALDHPNVATVLDIGESSGGRLYIAMPRYEGETLAERLEGGPLPRDEALEIARQLALGLGAAHGRDIVHRDVKPSNVILTPDGTAKLLDFGLARWSGITSLTKVGSSPGTPAYKSPEQTRGERVDPRSDLWALGVVLYEMLTGSPPFRGEYEQAIIYSILHEDPPVLEDDDLSALMTRALAKKPEDRFQSAEELAEACEAVQNGEPVLAAQGVVGPWRQRPTASLWLLAPILALGLMLGVFLPRWSVPSELPQAIQEAVRQGEEYELRGDIRRFLDHAVEVYGTAFERTEHPLLAAHLAACLVRLEAQFPEERREEIEELVRFAEAEGPDLAMTHVARAKLALLDGEAAAAEEAARRVIERDPESDRGYTLLGEALFAQDQRREGLEQMRIGAEKLSGRVRARLVLARYLRQAGETTEAIGYLEKVLEIAPDHPNALNNLGNLLVSQGVYAEAIPHLKAALAETEDYRTANALGNAYFYLDRMTEAIEAYEASHRLEPGHPTAVHNLGESHLKMGDDAGGRRWFETAVENYSRWLEDFPDSSRLLARRALCRGWLGQHADAIQEVEEALERSADHGEVLFRAAQVYALAGRPEESLDFARRAILQSFPREELRRDLALGQLEEEALRRLLETPDSQLSR